MRKFAKFALGALMVAGAATATTAAMTSPAEARGSISLTARPITVAITAPLTALPIMTPITIARTLTITGARIGADTVATAIAATIAVIAAGSSSR